MKVLEYSIALILTVVFLSNSFMSLFDIEKTNGESFLTSTWVSSQSYPSLTGRWDATDIATAVFEGEGFPSGRGRLGHFQWIGDVNGDGLNDIAVSAPGAVGANGYAGDGKIYIFFGNGSSPSGLIDLENAEPDILLTGYSWMYTKGPPPQYEPFRVTADLGNELEVGDYNGDGYRDMAIPVPISYAFTFTMIFWGREQGFPKTIVVETGELDKILNQTVIPRSNETREVIPECKKVESPITATTLCLTPALAIPRA